MLIDCNIHGGDIASPQPICGALDTQGIIPSLISTLGEEMIIILISESMSIPDEILTFKNGVCLTVCICFVSKGPRTQSQILSIMPTNKKGNSICTHERIFKDILLLNRTLRFIKLSEIS